MEIEARNNGETEEGEQEATTTAAPSSATRMRTLDRDETTLDIDFTKFLQSGRKNYYKTLQSSAINRSDLSIFNYSYSHDRAEEIAERLHQLKDARAHLVEIDLTECEIDEDVARLIASFDAKIISLQRTNSEPFLAFISLPHTQNLHTLNLQGCRISNDRRSSVATRDALRIILHIPSLRILNLSNNDICDKFLASLLRPPARSNPLDELDLSWNRIRGQSKAATTRLAALIQESDIKILKLSRNSLSSEACVTLFREIDPDWCRLTHIDLDANRLRGNQIKQIIGSLRQFASVESINFDNNPLTPTNMQTLIDKLTDDGTNNDTMFLSLLNMPIKQHTIDKLDSYDLRSRVKITDHLVTRNDEEIVIERCGNPVGENPLIRIGRKMRSDKIRLVELLKKLQISFDSQILTRDSVVNGLEKYGVPLITEDEKETIFKCLHLKKGRNSIHLSELMTTDRLQRISNAILGQSKPTSDFIYLAMETESGELMRQTKGILN